MEYSQGDSDDGMDVEMMQDDQDDLEGDNEMGPKEKKNKKKKIDELDDKLDFDKMEKDMEYLDNEMLYVDSEDEEAAEAELYGEGLPKDNKTKGNDFEIDDKSLTNALNFDPKTATFQDFFDNPELSNDSEEDELHKEMKETFSKYELEQIKIQKEIEEAENKNLLEFEEDKKLDKLSKHQQEELKMKKKNRKT